MDRSEDLKQVRDLHLVRDERDREVEAAAGLRAGNAVVLVSQLLSAVCLLQDDPAWMALLSLTLVWGGVKGFWRFRQDQERIYLVWGLLTCAGAAALLGLYFHRAWSAGMSFTRLLGYAVLCQVLTVAAGLLFVALLLGIFWLAHKLGHIEGERWEQYFQSGGCCDGGGPGSGGGPQRSPVRPVGLSGAGTSGRAVFCGKGRVPA